MHSPPSLEGASRVTGGIICGHAAGNAFQFADHSPGVKVESVVSFKTAAICLYTTTADPTISHVGGVVWLTFVKAKFPMNIYLHSVLWSLTTLDPSIECKL